MDRARGILLDTLNNIAHFFAVISDLFYSWGTWCSGKGILEYFTEWLYDLGDYFAYLTWEVIVLRESLLIIYDRTLLILDWSTIWSQIISIVPNLEEMRDWFSNWQTRLLSAITDWWWSVVSDVKDWISIAKQEVTSYVDFIKVGVDNLWTQWNEFRTVTLPTLVVSITLDDIIRSWFLDYEPFWAGWQEWRGKVTEFFSDPEQWFYNRLDNFFERFW